ncbi:MULTISPECIES: uracil-DNA glycosylase [Priestia]|uniref:uracil-DNA glycosylase n=1 Tax=Priestia TaxID=2800373 RepID=UPI000E1B427C|nr:uracil-DNA glycosylase [Priestia megaterium]QDZ77923.1 uracil-DNA glycosylase [Priestia megaterium]TPF15033.1 uracil-DNA glycosylase [Priestia megaterium]TPF20374.1 uracil-DNA glycosylase [Priestia megaterium]SUV13858.1 uracil-DNA glycosylase [Priestia megaterium]
MSILKNDWAPLLEEEFQKDYYIQLREFLVDEYNHHTIYPDKYDIFNALHYTDYKNVKVVILGQDPYHGPNQAHGLSFSVQPGVKTPPSLVNIYKELKNEMDYHIPNNGYLVKWAEQGVLLLNTVLTVRRGEANSHKGKGWEQLTDRIIELVAQKEEPVVFLLWGKHAQAKKELIHHSHHLILESPHPSPFSANRGFFGNNHFQRANEFLLKHGRQSIDWQIDDV